MKEVVAILTTEDKQILKSAILTIIIDRFKQDLDDAGEYIVSVYEIEELVKEAMYNAKEEFNKFVSEYYLEKMKSDFAKLQGENK